MRTRASNRSLLILLICIIATIPTAYTGLALPPVLGDNNVTLQPTQTATSNAASAVALKSNTLPAEFQVAPLLRSVTLGGYATYNIYLREEGNASIFLATRNIPPGSVAIFSRSNGLASPEFNSTITIITSARTLPATYSITVIALVNGNEYDNQIMLTVNSPTVAITQSGLNPIPNATSLTVSIETDRYHYQSNSTIFLQGHVTDNLGNAISHAEVTLQIDVEKGGEISALTPISTNTAGGFQANFTLPSEGPPGTYNAFAYASKQGFASATARTTFIVESSNTPSVVVQSVYAGDSAGNPLTVISPGQTVYVWVIGENIGVTFNGVIWVQIRDPSGVPVRVLIQNSSLASGQIFKNRFVFPLPENVTPGLYSVNALVSDSLISQGGVFLATANAQFEVNSS